MVASGVQPLFDTIYGIGHPFGETSLDVTLPLLGDNLFDVGFPRFKVVL